jgi:hypothetical protein
VTGRGKRGTLDRWLAAGDGRGLLGPGKGGGATMRIAGCLALVALMLVGWGPRAGDARAEVSVHLGYGFGYGYGYPYRYYRNRGYGYGYGYPYRHYRNRGYGYGYPYGYRHSYRFPRYRLGYTYSRPYYAGRAYVPSRAAPPPALAAPVAPVAPVAPYDTSYCREYTRQIVIDGEEQMAHGTACRQPDGTWRIID